MGSILDPLVNHPGRGLRAHSFGKKLTWRLTKTSPAPRSDGNPNPTPNHPYQPQAGLIVTSYYLVFSYAS